MTPPGEGVGVLVWAGAGTSVGKEGSSGLDRWLGSGPHPVRHMAPITKSISPTEGLRSVNAGDALDMWPPDVKRTREHTRTAEAGATWPATANHLRAIVNLW